MYGFVRFYKDNLPESDYGTYRSIYCSLCHSLEKNYGQIPRFLLSFDLTCMAIFAYALCPQLPESAQLAGCYGKLGKQTAVFKQLHFLDYCADISVLLAEQKLLDNKLDQEHMLRTYGLNTLFTPVFHKARQKQPLLAQNIDSYMQNFNAFEQTLKQGAKAERATAVPTSDKTKVFAGANADSAGQTANKPNSLLLSSLAPLQAQAPDAVTATLLFAELCRYLWQQLPLVAQARINTDTPTPGAAASADSVASGATAADQHLLHACLGEIGAMLGAYIYLIDALSDMAEDIKHKKFNILLYAWNDLNGKIKLKPKLSAKQLAKSAFVLKEQTALSAEEQSLATLIQLTEASLQQLLQALDAAAALLPFRRAAYLLANIIKDGLPHMVAHNALLCRYRLGIVQQQAKPAGSEHN